MQRGQTLLLSVMVGGLVLFCGITVAADPTSQEIAKTTLRSTVHLGMFDAQGNLLSTGSGFVIRNGRIATNYHVIEDISRGLARGLVKLVGKEEVYAVEAILVVDKERDLAIVKSAEIDVPALPLGDSDTVQTGDKVYVAGNPRGFEGTFTGGMINAIRPEGVSLVRGKVLQMDASISPGSSGGPVLNDSGKVIGISVAAYDEGRENLNFAIPVNYLKQLANIPASPPPGTTLITPRPSTLNEGIKLYEQARYDEAIKALGAIVRELEDSKQRAEAYLYLGCSKWGSGESNDQVREQFQISIYHNPDQKLPPRIGENHPVFGELLEEVRRELTGTLTVISLLPRTAIWINGNGIDKKISSDGSVRNRLLKGNYTVKGLYKGGSKKKSVTIEPNVHKDLNLGIPPIVKHDFPSRIPIGEVISLTLDLISSKAPQQIRIYYTIYDRDDNELEQNSQEMRLWEKQPTSSTWIYKVALPAQKHPSSIKYHIGVEYESYLTFRHPESQYSHYRISIADDKSLATTDEGNEGRSEPRDIEGEPSKPRSRKPERQGIWASIAANDASTSDRDDGNTFRLAYLREGKAQPTLGAQLDFSYPDRTNVSAIGQWGPALENSNIGLTFLGGITEYENFFARDTAARSTHTTPILGAGLKFYPQDNIVIDVTSSIKIQSDIDTTNLYHYEIGIRFYTTRELSLRAGYGKLYLGDRNVSAIQVGLGYNF